MTEKKEQKVRKRIKIRRLHLKVEMKTRKKSLGEKAIQSAKKEKRK
jgi:hypothetical protein